MRLRDVNYWYVLAAIFAAFTVASALGEWVFRWWREPGELASAAGAVLTLLALGFGASRADVRQLGRRFDQMLDAQHGMLASQERMLASQERTLASQERSEESLRRLLEGQGRQSELLEQVAAYFRGQAQP